MSESPKKVAKRPEYFLAFDIERTGSAKKYGVLAVGTCFGTKGGDIIETRAFCGKVPPPEGFDPSTREFWSKFPEVLERIDAEAVEDHMEDLHAYLLDLETRFGPFGKGCDAKLRLVTDNPGYDSHWISTMFYELFGDKAKAIAEMFHAYVPTDDPSEQHRFLLPSERAYVDACAAKAPHGHWPVDDATHHYLRQCALEDVWARRAHATKFTKEQREQLMQLIEADGIGQFIAELVAVDKAMLDLSGA
jgi:hypothetical protein